MDPDPGRKQRMTSKKKAHELATFSGANVYFITDHPRAKVSLAGPTFYSFKLGKNGHEQTSSIEVNHRKT